MISKGCNCKPCVCGEEKGTVCQNCGKDYDKCECQKKKEEK
ncbi:MAG TPA: hypothetical protein VMX77_01535 [Candidatus Bathyarchaeia archaeon]|nr:hypothetical protein [Candidatus Bathyarchaeia archaeon]